jgi:hypothetical protein
MAGVSTRWMTVIAFALGMAACTANQRELGEMYGATPGAPSPPGSYVALGTFLGIVMLVAGIVAFVLASAAMLAAACGHDDRAVAARHRLAHADRPPSAAARPPCRALRTQPRDGIC